MAGLWEQIKGLFDQVEKSSANHPVVHELIERSETQNDYLVQFSNGITFRQILEWIKEKHFSHLQSPLDKTDHLQFINTKGLNGFVIYFSQTNYSQKEVIAFFDALKNIVLQDNYVSYVSDRRAYVKNGFKEEIQRHYLKPSLRKTKDKLLPQFFGNINIELLFRDNEAQHLKFVATFYNDHLYAEAKPFKQLIDFITK